jgi:hypothetical protein
MTDEETEAAAPNGEGETDPAGDDGEAASAGGDTGDGEIYVCGACGKEFDSREALERHVHDVGIVD